ncbi:MAG: hypothetical protein GY842_14825 [bacterium]|nr:hypothetical protein [bacterium]
MNANQRKLLTDVLTLPTAPFAEHAIIDAVRRFCRQRPSLTITEDPSGNLLVRYRHGRRVVKHPVCLTAHLDHPGFVAERMIDAHTVRASWRGGVKPDYFLGSKVRFWTDDGRVRGTVQSIRRRGRGLAARVQSADIRVRSAVPHGAVGMWDLPDPTINRKHIRSRACDDLAGVGGMLCCLDELCRKRVTGEGYFLFTRAEEVGFVGAMAACRRKTIPRRCVVVVIETSSELPHARIGDGPVMRVGDRASVFDPTATAFCRGVADQLAKRSRAFAYQRKLMDGGSCEASAFCDFGYRATCVCLALGNYHNMDVKRGRIGSEFVSTADFDNLVKWFVGLIGSGNQFAEHDAEFRARLRSIEKEHTGLLESTR